MKSIVANSALTTASIVLLAVMLLGVPIAPDARSAQPNIQSLPFVQLQPLGNSTSNTAEFRKKPLLLQFWASWCHSCSAIMFDLDELLQMYPGTDYLAISLDEEQGDARQYIEKHSLYQKYNDRYFIDLDKLLATKLGVETVPTIILLDAAGNEIVRKSGHLNSADLQQFSSGMKAIQR